MIREMFSFNNHAENEAGKLVPDCFFFFWKSFIFGKSDCSAAWYYHILVALKLACNKKNCLKLDTTDPETCSILIF